MKKVLVVIHNRSELRRIVTTLKAAGLNVLVAADGLAGYQAFKQHQPDAVIINLLIPKLAGGELCKRIKNESVGKILPVILLSSLFKKTDMSRVALEQWHADSYFQAPYELADLVNLLFSLLPPETEEEKAQAVAKTDEAAVLELQPEPEQQRSQTKPPAKPTGKREETLEELLAKTLAEMDQSSLMDRSPRVAQIEEEISAGMQLATESGKDKISDLLDNIASKALGEHMDNDVFGNEPLAVDELEVAPQSEDFSEEGNLEDVSIPELFAQLYLDERTGILELNHLGSIKNVYFDQGRAVFVESEGRQESLGQILVRQGIINDDEVLLSLENMTAYGHRQGEALIEMGKLNPMQLYQALRFQMREKLLSLFTWFEGTYFFDETPFDINSLTVFELPMPALIFEGIVTHYDAGSIKEMFSEIADQVVARNEKLPFSRRSSNLGAEVWTMYDRIVGEKTLKDIIAKSPLNADKTYLTLYAMLILRMFDRKRDLEEEEEVIAVAPQSEQKKKAMEDRVFFDEGDVIDDQEELINIDEEPESEPDEIVFDDAASAQDDLEFEEEELKPSPPVLKPIDQIREEEPSLVSFDSLDENASEEELAERMAGDLEKELADFEKSTESDSELVRIDREKPNVDEFAEQIVNLYLKIDNANYYEIMELPRNCDDLAVKYAYEQKKKKFSPNKIEVLTDAELKNKAQAVVATIKTAYETLSSPNKRSEYDRRLTPEGEELKERRITTILAAERAFNQGALALRRGAIAQAQKHFEEAVELFPEEAEYYAYLGWTHFSNTALHEQQRVLLAKEAIEKSLKINPKGDKAHLFLGKILLAHGNKDKASKMFALAFRYNKNNEEAKLELRRLQQEKEKERAELKSLEDEEKLSNLIRKDIDFQQVKKAIKKLFW